MFSADRSGTRGRALALVLGLSLILAPGASAYIDGGTASMLFQLMAGGLFAGLVFLKTFWINVKSFVNRVLRRGTSPVDD